MDLLRRFKEYSRLHCKEQPLLFAALNKYGVDTCLLNIVDNNLNQIEANKREIYYINKYQSFRRQHGYNLTMPSTESSYALCEEVRKKISNSLKGKPSSSSTKFKEGQAPWIKGKKHSRESKEKMSISSKGKPQPIHHTENKIKFIYTITYFNNVVETTDWLSKYCIDKGFKVQCLRDLCKRKSSNVLLNICSVTRISKSSKLSQ